MEDMVLGFFIWTILLNFHIPMRKAILPPLPFKMRKLSLREISVFPKICKGASLGSQWTGPEPLAP